MHPTPWKVTSLIDASGIFDANEEFVETVYSRKGDPQGRQLADRIVNAVNSAEAQGVLDT